MLSHAYHALKNPKMHWGIKIMSLLLILACVLGLFWGGFDLLPDTYAALINSSDLFFSVAIALLAGAGVLSFVLLMYAAVDTLAGAQKDFEQLEPVMKLAIRALGSEKTARRWLDHSIPSLGSKTPREILRTPGGEEMIKEELTRIEYGMFS